MDMDWQDIVTSIVKLKVDTAAATMTEDDAGTTTAESFPRSKRWRALLVVPYLLGIAWTSVHPILSIMTGEAKCRGSFTDENSLEPSHLILEKPYSISSKTTGKGSSSLCKSLEGKDLRDNVECITHKGFQVAKIAPLSHLATAESMVLVVPSADDWQASVFHKAILELMTRLASPQSCPWLSKTILIVSPVVVNDGNRTINSSSLQTTVSSFLDAYLGSRSGEWNVGPLPIRFTVGILRTLLVMDVTLVKDPRRGTELQVLPQGRRGVLPNMDLVFVTNHLYRRSNLMQRNSRTPDPSLVMHPFGDTLQRWKEWLHTRDGVLPLSVRHWAYELGSLALFGRSLVAGPVPAHAPALDRGVDALTLHLSSNQPQSTVEYVQTVQLVLRALSNLHERLHHSLTQYVLPSPFTFVSHAEYLLPNVLVLLPLVLWALVLILVDIERFDWGALASVGAAVGLAGVLSWGSTFEVTTVTAFYVGAYALRLSAPSSSPNSWMTFPHDAESHLFVTCLFAVYAHVPLLLAHVSLSWPSSVVWTFLLLTFPLCLRRPWQSLVFGVLLLVTWPPIFLVPTLFGTYTPYVTWVYTPLHLLLCTQWTLLK